MSNHPTDNPDFGDGTHCCETSGFLFSHKCDQISVFVCNSCGKPICHQHTVYNVGENLCVSCTKVEKPDDPNTRYRREPNSPYWYADHYYSDYSWRNDDFNDADESVLMGDDDGVQWENDMGAS